MCSSMLENESLIKMLQERIRKNGSIKIQVHGCSMYPVINNGDTVEVIRADEINVGDIVCYFIGNAMVQRVMIVHRVYCFQNNCIITKGDNNSFVDQFRIRRGAIVGKISLSTNTTVSKVKQQ